MSYLHWSYLAFSVINTSYTVFTISWWRVEGFICLNEFILFIAFPLKAINRLTSSFCTLRFYPQILGQKITLRLFILVLSWAVNKYIFELLSLTKWALRQTIFVELVLKYLKSTFITAQTKWQIDLLLIVPKGGYKNEETTSSWKGKGLRLDWSRSTVILQPES